MFDIYYMLGRMLRFGCVKFYLIFFEKKLGAFFNNIRIGRLNGIFYGIFF